MVKLSQDHTRCATTCILCNQMTVTVNVMNLLGHNSAVTILRQPLKDIQPQVVPV